MLNFEKIKQTYNSRNNQNDGITAIAFYCMNNTNWYDEVTEKINSEISENFGDIYYPYSCHRHITIMGLEELIETNASNIAKLLRDFPILKIEMGNFFLTENGLIVGEFYPTSEDAKILSEYRSSFEQYGIKYKYPQNAHKFHTVLGQLIPKELEMLLKEDLLSIENEINMILNKIDGKLTNDCFITHNDIKIVKYKTTSLQNIANINILSSTNFDKLSELF